MAHIRTPFVGGNWKMNTELASATALAGSVASALSGRSLPNPVQVAVFPPFPYLLACAGAIKQARGPVALGAQDVYHAAKGAFTGEVSPAMLRDCGCEWVLCGHSERRHVLHEGDDMVNAKLRTALAHGLSVVLCVGEKLEQRVTGQTDTVNERQIRQGLRDVPEADLARVVVAYEPVWAIGTGKNALPEDAQDAHAKIRGVLADMFSKPAATAMRLIYGGSCTPANAASLIAMPDIDGGLIGGASLKPDDFWGIIEAASVAPQ